MKVVARDLGTPVLSSIETNVTVFVGRNLFAPRFVRTPYVVQLAENQQIGEQLLLVTAVDDDTRVSFNNDYLYLKL